MWFLNLSLFCLFAELLSHFSLYKHRKDSKHNIQHTYLYLVHIYRTSKMPSQYIQSENDFHLDLIQQRKKGEYSISRSLSKFVISHLTIR